MRSASARRYHAPVHAMGLAAVVVLAGTITVAMAGCGPFSDSRNADVDLLPPQLQSVRSEGPAEVSVTFDEEASLCQDARVSPPLALSADADPNDSRRVTLRGERQVPGQRYVLEAEARDLRGNTASFAAEFYGYNGRVPRLLINEITPRGSDSHPDTVEIKALTGGNLGGAVLFFGSPQSHDARLVFPPLEVKAGGFIVVHLKPAGDPAEVDESTDPAASGGKDASSTAWDLWMKDSQGLPGSNGALSLCDRVGGACLDAVLWSNRTSQSDEAYGGFGSEQMRARAEELAQAGAWPATGTRISPEDAVNPEGSTATRSLCRSSASADTNTAADWHIVPTRKASPGADNTDEVYAP